MNARRLLFIGCLVLTLSVGCKTIPKYRGPAPDLGQILIELAAVPKVGVRSPRQTMDAGAYGAISVEQGEQYGRVDYNRLRDIAVLIKNPNLDDQGPVPRETRLVVDESGFDHQLVLLGPNGMTRLIIENRRERRLTFFSIGETGDGFDRSVDPGSSAEVTLGQPGVFELFCEQDETLYAQLVVAETTYAALGASGGHIFFDNLLPGRYEIMALAARLPAWTVTVDLPAGTRQTLQAKISVNTLPRTE